MLALRWVHRRGALASIDSLSSWSRLARPTLAEQLARPPRVGLQVRSSQQRGARPKCHQTQRRATTDRRGRIDVQPNCLQLLTMVLVPTHAQPR